MQPLKNLLRLFVLVQVPLDHAQEQAALGGSRIQFQGRFRLDPGLVGLILLEQPLGIGQSALAIPGLFFDGLFHPLGRLGGILGLAIELSERDCRGLHPGLVAGRLLQLLDGIRAFSLAKQGLAQTSPRRSIFGFEGQPARQGPPGGSRVPAPLRDDCHRRVQVLPELGALGPAPREGFGKVLCSFHYDPGFGKPTFVQGQLAEDHVNLGTLRILHGGLLQDASPAGHLVVGQKHLAQEDAGRRQLGTLLDPRFQKCKAAFIVALLETGGGAFEFLDPLRQLQSFSPRCLVDRPAPRGRNKRNHDSKRQTGSGLTAALIAPWGASRPAELRKTARAK